MCIPHSNEEYSYIVSHLQSFSEKEHFHIFFVFGTRSWLLKLKPHSEIPTRKESAIPYQASKWDMCTNLSFLTRPKKAPI